MLCQTLKKSPFSLGLAVMTTMVTEIYHPLREAGASEEKARRAAEVLADYNDRFSTVQTRMDRVQSSIDALKIHIERQVAELRAALSTELQREMAALRPDLEPPISRLEAGYAVLRWMVGTSIALDLAVLVKLFVH